MLEILGNIEFKSDLNRVYVYIADRFSLPKRIRVNLNFISSDEIRKLNKSTREIDKVTDVLTYPYINLKPNEKLRLKDYSLDIDPEDKILTIGDIYICTERAVEQARLYNHTLKREVCFLFCHGMLHLLGYDHIERADEEIMTKLQEEIMTKLNIGRDVPFKSGFVTIVGDTNVGKSTLINKLVGEHVAIVTPKSQTTRETIVGVYNDEHTQIVFLDTPGYHKHSYKIDDAMDRQIENATEDTEIILMMISARRPLVQQYDEIVKKINSRAKKILLINKIDEVSYEKLYPELTKLGGKAVVDEILPISALKGKNCDVLIDMIKKYLPEYDYEMRYYPVDEYTDKDLRHMCAEIIREKALMALDDEIPHGIHVVVTDYKESADPVEIYADLYCERENHKSIILGKNGAKIKEISTKSRISIEKLIEKRVNLQIFVKVKPNWRNDEKMISTFGLDVSE